MANCIVFYCKDCGKLFFAAVNMPHVMREAAKDIAEYLAKGHRMSEVDTSTVRVTMERCTCDDSKQPTLL